MERGFVISVEKDDDGYFAHIPAVQGCYAQGDTYEEVLANISPIYMKCYT